MTAPVVASYNSNQTAASFSCAVTLTNAPPAGGIVVVLAAAYSGGGGGSWSCNATGGSGLTITNRYNPLGTTNSITNVLIWTVEYSSAPTALTVTRSGASGDTPYISAVCVNVTGQHASYLDGCNGSTGSSAAPVATALPDLTDATDLVLGVMSRNSADGTTVAAGTNWTEIVEIDETNSTYTTLNAIQRTPGATGTYDPTWALGGSPGSDTWYAAGISIKGTASAIDLMGQACL